MKFTKGRYYIGDPVYVISDEDWGGLLNATKLFTSKEQFYKGVPILAGKTIRKNGICYDDKNRKYSIDSGNLSIIPIEVIDMKKFRKINNKNICHVIEFKNDFDVEIENGTFKFGGIFIDA